MKAHLGTGRFRAILSSAILCVGLTSCSSLPTASHHYNPLGWPSVVVGFVGSVSVKTEIPLLREAGRLLEGVGELIDAPALLVEGVATLDPFAIVAAGQHTIAGSGGTLGAVYNLPLFVVPGMQIDLASTFFFAQQGLQAADRLAKE